MNKQKQYKSNGSAVLSGLIDLHQSRKTPDVRLLDTDRMEGKTVLITGASSGLGLAASRELARRGARVLMVCRRDAEAERIAVALAGEKHGGSAEIVRANLTDFASIRRLADELEAAGEKVDVFISNAGVVSARARKTVDGFEEMLQVNSLAPALFIRLLLEKKLFNGNSPSVPRIVVVDSEAHRSTDELRIENLTAWEDFKMAGSTRRYGWTKLVLLTWVRELTRRHSEISVHAMCPGPVASNIAREVPAPVRPVSQLFFKIFFQSPEKAAIPVVFLAASQSIEGETGRYQFLMKNRKPSNTALDPEMGRMLWKAIGEIISPFLGAVGP